MVVVHWTASEVLGWADEIHLSPTTIALFREKQFTGRDTVALDRPAMTGLGICALDQSRILGNVHALLSTDTCAEALPTELTRNSSSASSRRRQTISYSVQTMSDTMRDLKSRVWELFQHDVVASRTTRLLVEGDLIKYQDKKSGQTRRFLLLDTCLLWCSVKSRGKTPETDQLTLKGRLDVGQFSVVDLLDGTKNGKRVVKNAFKIFNKDKEKWYTLVAYDADSKTQWLHAFGEAGIIVEKASSFDPSKYDHPDLTAGLTNEEAMAIMIKVRDGKLNVDAALELAKESSAKAAEKDATPATVDMDKDVNDELILVLGATGTIGQRVASKLLEAGARVRLGSRNPEKLAQLADRGADVVEFDYERSDTWGPALSGCEAAFVVAPFTPEFSKSVIPFIDAAKEAGLKHITKLSGFGTPTIDEPEPVDMRGAAEHRLADGALRQSELGWTLLKPQWFMSNFLGFQGDTISSDAACFYGASSGGRVGYVSPDDVADVAVVTLTNFTEHNGKSYDLTGPVALTDSEVAAALSTHLGKTVQYVDVSAEVFEESLKKTGIPSWNAEEAAALEKVKASGVAATVTTAVSDVLGRPALSLADFFGPVTSDAAAEEGADAPEVAKTDVVGPESAAGTDKGEEAANDAPTEDVAPTPETDPVPESAADASTE